MERRHLSQAPAAPRHPRRRLIGRVLFGSYLTLAGIIGAPLLAIEINTNGVPRAQIAVTSTTGLSAAATLDRAHDLAHTRGWTLDQNGSGCRRDGWIIDRTIECINIAATNGRVAIYLTPASQP